MKKICQGLFILFVFMSLSACNTIQGIGRDIEKSGQAIEKAASK